MFYRSVFLSLAAMVAALVVFPQPAVAAPGDIVINELFWMGSSRSAADEWIELRNLTSADIPLDNWALFKKSGGNIVPMLTIPAGKSIPANGLFLIANYAETNPNSSLAVQPDLVTTDVALVNSDLQITLADATSTTIDVADDGVGTPFAGKYVSGKTWSSMERNFVPGDGREKTSWHTASASVNLQSGAEPGTPRAANSNLPPEIRGLSDRQAAAGEAIPFDVSESSDPDGDPLTFVWDFGDGDSGTGATPVHTFMRSGTFSVVVIASDGQMPVKATATVTVQPTTAASLPVTPAAPPQEPSRSAPPSAPASTPSPPTPGKTAVGSPGPGPGKGLRFSELFPDPLGRDADEEFIEFVNISQEPLRTEGWQVTDGKKKAILPPATLAPDEWLVMRPPTLSLVLRNAGATFYLLDPSGAIRDGVKYRTAKAGRSFSRAVQRWYWAEPTPNAANAPPPIQEKDQSQPAAEKDTAPAIVSADEARQADSGTKLALTGTVVVPPGVLADRQFLLGDATGTIVITTDRVASLPSGARVQLLGKKSTAKEPRINAKATDLKQLGSGPTVDPIAMAVGDVSEEDLGAFVSLTGTVKEKRSRTFTLDDESGSLTVGGPQAQTVTKEAGVIATGVVRQSSGRLRLVATAIEISEPPAAPAVLGATATATAPATPAEQLTGNAATPPRLGYALLGLAGTLLLLRLWLQSRFGTRMASPKERA